MVIVGKYGRNGFPKKGKNPLKAIHTSAMPKSDTRLLTEEEVQAILYHSTNGFVFAHLVQIHRNIADFVTLTSAGTLAEYEIKRSLSDFKKDFEKRKHADIEALVAGAYKPKKGREHWTHPNQFYYVVQDSVYAQIMGQVPPYAGICVLRRAPGGTEEVWEMKIEREAPMLHKERNFAYWVSKLARSLSFKARKNLGDLAALRLKLDAAKEKKK